MQSMTFRRYIHLVETIVIVTLFAAVLFKGVGQELFGKESFYNDFTGYNHMQINLSDNGHFKSFRLLDPYLKDNAVFLTGESHGVAINTRLSVEFLKYFNRRANVRYYLCEIGYSNGILLNDFLETGDEAILKKLYEPLKGTFGWNRQEYEKWKEIYEYNCKLPAGKKITIVGIDIEHQFENAIWGLYSLLPGKEPPSAIKPLIEKLKYIYKAVSENRKDVELDDILQFSNELKDSFKRYQDVYEAYLADSLFDFQIINDNMLKANEAYAAGDSSIKDEFNRIRDTSMYENFVKVYSHLPKGKYYGQFGNSHIYQRPMGTTNWLAYLLDKAESPVAEKVLSITYIYDNCTFLNKSESGRYAVDNLTTYSYGDGLLQPYLQSDLVMFGLTGKNSPFEKSMKWYSIEKKPEAGVLTDYYQFILYIRGSQATEPLGG